MCVGSFEPVRFFLYFVPRENSPLIHLHATSLSPHNCTVGTSLRVWTVVSAGPKSLGVFVLIFMSSLVLFFLSSVGSIILLRTNLCFSSVVFFFFFYFHPVFLARPTCGDLIPHIPSFVPSPFMLPSCAVFRILFQHSRLQAVPPCRTSPLLNFFETVCHCITFPITNPSHGSPQTFCNFFMQDGKPICINIFLAILLVLLWKSTHVSSFCLVRRNKRIIVLVSHPLIFSIVCTVHDQLSLTNAKTA